QLIQQFVTSNPSPNYVRDVAQVFNNNGSGVRGDMRAVVRAILLHSEARGIARTEPNYGQLREPALFVTNILRAFNVRSADGSAARDGSRNPQPVTMGQDISRPVWVFSYFPAGYVVPGTSLRGPEFGILSTATALARANFGNRIVFSRIAVSPNGPAGTSIDLS